MQLLIGARIEAKPYKWNGSPVARFERIDTNSVEKSGTKLWCTSKLHDELVSDKKYSYGVKTIYLKILK